MKIRADCLALSAAAAEAARALASKPVVPVMSGALVVAEKDGTVTFSGYDYETFISASIVADVLQPGRVLVPGKILAAFLAAMPEGPVELIDEGSRLRVSGKGCRYSLGAMVADDYPQLPAAPPIVGQVDGAALSRAVGRASVAARPGDGKIWWHGVVHLEATPEYLLLGSTDGNSASRTTVAWDGEAPAQFEGEIQARLLAEATRGLAGPVGLCADDGQLGLVSAGRTVLSRRIGEKYIGWRRLVESLPTAGTHVRVPRADLLAAAQRAQKVLGAGGEPLRLRFGGGSVAYELASSAGNDVLGAIDVLEHDGEDMEIGFAPQYLADAVSSVAGEVVELRLAGPTKVVVVVDPDGDDCDLQLVMPKRLQR